MTQNFAERGAKRYFDYPGLTIGHIIIKAQHLRPTTHGSSDTCECSSAITHNDWHIGKRLNAVDSGRLIPQPILCREGWALFRHTTTALDKGNLHGFLAAHEANISPYNVDGTT